MKAEKIKNTERQWSSGDVVDFEYFVIHTSSKENPGESAQQARHWFQQNFSDHTQDRLSELPDSKVLKAWLSHQKAQFKSDVPLPGESWQWLMGLFHWILLVLGLLTGASVTASLIKYDGLQPVNVAMFFCLLIGVQLVWSFLSFLLIAGKGLQWIPLQAGFSLRIFHLLLHWASTRLHRHLIVKLATEKRMVWQSFWRHLRQDHGASGKYLIWSILAKVQMMGVAFNVGVILMFMVSVMFRDLAFGWQTSVEQINNETIAIVVKTLSIPWNWIWGEGQGFPSLVQIEGSRIILKDGINSIQNTHLTSWWPFLLLAVIFYGLMPRTILYGWLSVLEQRQLSSYPLESDSCQKLWKRFHTPFLNVIKRPFDKHSQSKDGALASSILKDSTAMKVPRPANSPGLDIPCWVYMDERMDQFNDLGGLESQLSSQGWHLKEALDFSSITELAQFDGFTKGDCLLWVEEAWQPPIQEKINRLKKCLGFLPSGIFLCIGLIGKPQGDQWLTPVRLRDLEIWQKFIHQHLPEDVQVRTLLSS